MAVDGIEVLWKGVVGDILGNTTALIIQMDDGLIIHETGRKSRNRKKYFKRIITTKNYNKHLYEDFVKRAIGIVDEKVVDKMEQELFMLKL